MVEFGPVLGVLLEEKKMKKSLASTKKDKKKERVTCSNGCPHFPHKKHLLCIVWPSTSTAGDVSVSLHAGHFSPESAARCDGAHCGWKKASPLLEYCVPSGSAHPSQRRQAGWYVLPSNTAPVSSMGALHTLHIF